jgi:formylglycine-generating enzyme required for sulfatase activity
MSFSWSRLLLPVLLVASAGCTNGRSAVRPPALLLVSELGRQGPEYGVGVTPSSLGWGPDSRAYPAAFVVNPRDGAELVWVPMGEFVMGSMDGEADERPPHRVRITHGFWIYRYPVTNAQYRKMRPRHDSGDHDGRALNEALQPVVNVTWSEAASYAAWAGMQLPREAQWEYSARAGSTGRFYWGDSETEAGKYGNFADRSAKAAWPSWAIFDTTDGYAVSSPVGSFLPNQFGLYDALGNVWQWCADWYQPDYYGVSPVDDPRGPPGGEFHVIRGGSWDCFPAHSRSAYRSWLIPPETRYPWLGFRCVAPPAM